MQDARGTAEDEVKGLEKEEPRLKTDQNVCISIRSKQKLMRESHGMEPSCDLG